MEVYQVRHLPVSVFRCVHESFEWTKGRVG